MTRFDPGQERRYAFPVGGRFISTGKRFPNRTVVPDSEIPAMKKQSSEKGIFAAVSSKTRTTERNRTSLRKSAAPTAVVKPVSVNRKKKSAEPVSMPTIRDVAVMTGFSMATVSRVISGRGSVLQETADLIRTAARRLGYSPDRAAQALAMRSAMVRQYQARLRQAS
jgi:transcriptional regulator with XRE-family HTH domain